MRYRDTGEYETISNLVSLVDFDENYPLESFDCGIEDYNNFLLHDAKKYIELGISAVQLLIDNESNAVLGYIAMLTDSFYLDSEEKNQLELDVPFNSVPALKVGKLATHKDRNEFHYGCYLLELSLGYAQNLLEEGIACRFLTVDTDIEFREDTPSYYEMYGFVRNLHKNQKRKNVVSMRYDIFS
ncbi:N-acetyltransferase [Paenibacillus sp. HB172176]|uniref:N-acetyltransferase n=1 Tax=Paenibacillus sp. HB172176 TaxID=2493690 RepID=UPI00143AF968|nr:N-acetyltransferase [Paenibacillus sp. HB172176]